MSGYVIGGWGTAAGILVIYGWRTIRRGRRLALQLPAPPPEEPSAPEGPWR